MNTPHLKSVTSATASNKLFSTTAPVKKYCIF
jgi:hypothetical protein